MRAAGHASGASCYEPCWVDPSRVNCRQAFPNGAEGRLAQNEREVALHTVRVLHVSDLHASEARRPQQVEIASALVADVERMHAARAIDLMVFSGDLANVGAPAEFDLAENLIIRPLMAATDLSVERVVMVPGNHDVNRAAISRPMERGLETLLSSDNPQAARQELVTLFAESDPELDSARLTAWREFSQRFYAASVPTPIHPNSLFFRASVHDIEVGIIALNSAWRSAGDEDKGRLIVGAPQLDAGLALAAGTDLQIVVLHHPLEWLADWDANDLRRALEHSRLLVLSGHQHVPDPTSEFTSRGSAVYARAGCLYERPDYHNGYSILDVDVRTGQVAVNLRTWFGQEHDRHSFGVAENLVEGGVVNLRLGVSQASLVADSAGYSNVLAGVAEALDERTLPTPTAAGGLSSIERLVAPRFWPVPSSEMTALRIQDKAPKPSEPLGTLDNGGRCVVVSGESGQGVTSALAWILAQRFSKDATRLPALIGTLDRLDSSRIERAVRNELTRAGVALGRGDPLPPMVVAIDDVDTGDSRGLARLAAYVNAHEDWLFLIGSHRDDQEALERPFSDLGIAVETTYLGPLGRREARELVAATIGPEGGDLVDQVLTVIVRQGLPRSPLTMSALAFVLAEGAAAGVTNHSALLEAYVGLFLGSNEAFDYSRVGLDHRGRVHLLGWLAALLDDIGVTTLPRVQAEARVAEYFEARLMSTVSPGAVLTDLVSRRVLRDLDGYVDFRSPALLELFRAMWMREDEGLQYRANVMADPLGHAAVAEHYSGLKRDSRELLERVGDVLAEAVTRLGKEISIDMFDAVSDRPGWSNELPDIEALREMNPPPAPRRDDAALDERFEEYATSVEARDVTNGAERDENSTLQDPLEDVLDAVRLLSAILTNSELVSDVELRRRLFVAALRAWSLVLVGLALKEDMVREVGRQVAPLLEREAPPSEHAGEEGRATGDGDSFERVVETLITLAQCVVTTRALGAQNVEQIAAAALDSQDVMDETATALAGTMLYCLRGLSGWVWRLAQLRKAHGQHPVVERIVRAVALAAYHSRLPGRQVKEVEDFLVDVFVARAGITRSSSGRARAAARENVRKQLRESRRRHLRASDVIESDVLMALDEDTFDEDDNESAA